MKMIDALDDLWGGSVTWSFGRIKQHLVKKWTEVMVLLTTFPPITRFPITTTNNRPVSRYHN
jgi:hypothetical protein